MDLNEILKVAVQSGASDIHLKAGMPPIFRINGSLRPLKDGRRMSPEELEKLSNDLMTSQQRQLFEQRHELDCSHAVPGLGRFRVNIFMQRGARGLVLRSIPFKINNLEQLNMPPIISKVCMESRGLILVTGTTGSGKSTTLAGMIDHINTHQTCHILTIEDPIEFIIRDKRSIINQRELGADTFSFSAALRAALRQDPDVILVGEMRDMETIETAMTAAETGHLVMSTLHTMDAPETINRIISIFPPHQQKQVRMQLAAVLKAVVSQRLVPRADGRGRVPAVEVLVRTAAVKEMIEDANRTREIPDAIKRGHDSYGMQSFDQSLMFLLQRQFITFQEALEQSTNRDDFILRVKGISSTSDSSWDGFDPTGKQVPANQAPPGAAAKPAVAQGPQKTPGFEIERFGGS